MADEEPKRPSERLTAETRRHSDAKTGELRDYFFSHAELERRLTRVEDDLETLKARVDRIESSAH